MNQVIISGRLTKDISLQYVSDSGTAVARFSVALDRGKDRNGNDRGTDFPNCVAFGKTAENLERYSGKGCRVLVAGRLQTGSYEKDGQKVYTTDVIADRVEFIDWKGKDGQNANNGSTGGVPEGFMAVSDSDIPF